MKHNLRVVGHVPSKKNLYRRNRTGKCYVPRRAKAELDSLQIQLQSQWNGRAPLMRPDVSIAFGVRSRRQDPDNQATTIIDLLVKAGVLYDDRCGKIGTITIHPPRVCAEEYAVVTLDVQDDRAVERRRSPEEV